MKKTMAIAFAAVSIGCLAGTPKNGAGRSSGVSMEIVLPEKPNVSERLAADELKYHFSKATGGMFSVVSENAPKSGLRRFYVGRAAACGGVDVAALKPEERVVKGVGRDVFIAGGDRHADGGAMPGNTGGRVCFGTLYAAYDFLENEMGVRWIWPGELGEVVPKRAIPVIDGVERRGREPLVLRKFGGEPDTDKVPSGGRMLGWADVENARRDVERRRTWLARHRLGARRKFNGSHAFTDWWSRYGKEHPEFFNLLPNGRREPLQGDDTGKNVTLCVSQPALWRQIVANWSKSGAVRPQPYYVPCVNVCENDTPGMCTCAACRSWDAPDPLFAENDYWNGSGKCPLTKKGRFRLLADVQWGETGGTKVLLSLPSVSDRYAKFYNAVLAEARKKVKDAVVYGYAYANYLAAPKQTKVSDGVIISFVPRMYFPYTRAESDYFRKHWTGWRNAGATQMIYRPNYMLAGANMPINTARRIASDIAFAAGNGMMAISQDSLTGIWSAQAIQNYVVTRLMRDPKLGYEKALDEFASAFRPAEKEMKDYCAFLEDVGKGLSVEDWQELGQRNKDPRGNAGGGFKNFVLVAADLYSEAWYDRAESLLGRVRAKAAKSGASGAIAVKRVDFMLKGLKDARLTYRTRVAQKAWQADSGSGAKKKAFEDAFETMRRYRASVEGDGVASYFWTAARERDGAGWPHRH